ncbi:TIF1A [Mytilus edulis]|uniref:TRIM24 n=1 Tax=Mytilus edulis TaxID=6550 RepID=A0A8S3VC83_MYTED|nr:TIF1A [Mytilus edulis]
MALYKSPQSEQALMICQMCEESNEIKWICLQCDFFMCTKCQKLHKRVKSTDQHTILDIKDIDSYYPEIINPPDLESIPCCVHKREVCWVFCQTCEEVICGFCIGEAHETHVMIGLTAGYKLTMKAVKDLHTEVVENILQTESGLSKLSLNESSVESTYESERQNILNRKAL